MRNNPLHIKWFVSAVQAGQRPEQVLADEKVFLQFCLANVFSQVSENAKTLVRTLLALGGRYTVAELSYLTDLGQAELLNAIQELMRTNMFFSTSTPTAVSFETKYELSQLARAYLTRFYPVNKDTQKIMLKAKQRLVSAGEQIAAEALSNPLSASSIHCRSRSDWVIARYLREALSKIRVGDFEAALGLVSKAQGLAPDFSEVYRVEAWAYAKSGNLSQAYDSYSKAVELASDSAIAYHLFGGFLLRDMHDSERASEMFKKAHELCPERPEPEIELARCYLYVRDFGKVEKIINELESKTWADEHVKLKICDLHLQLYTRRADRYCVEQQYFSCKDSLQKAKEYYLTISHPDRRMRERLAKLLYLRAPLATHWEGDPAERSEIERFFVWLDEVLFEDRESGSVPDGAVQPNLALNNEGYIATLHGSGRFGFIRQDDGGDLYFRIGEYRRCSPEDAPRVGLRVRFEVKFDWKGRIVAVNVRAA
jgi:Flp pilus assembly protein TadD